MKPFPIPGHGSNTPRVLVVLVLVLLVLVLMFAAVMSGCNHQSQIPSQSPRAVRLAIVAAPETAAETLRYSASILPYAQAHLMFRSSRYLTHVRQGRGADGRTRR